MADLPYTLFTNDKNQQLVQSLDKGYLFQIIKFKSDIEFDNYRKATSKLFYTITGYRIVFQLESVLFDSPENQISIDDFIALFVQYHIDKNKSYFKRYKI